MSYLIHTPRGIFRGKVLLRLENGLPQESWDFKRFQAKKPQIAEQNQWYCWWFRNPANSPVEVGRLSHYLPGFFTSQVVSRIPSNKWYQSFWGIKNPWGRLNYRSHRRGELGADCRGWIGSCGAKGAENDWRQRNGRGGKRFFGLLLQGRGRNPNKNQVICEESVNFCHSLCRIWLDYMLLH